MDRKNFKLSAEADVPPAAGMVLDAGGVWREVVMIDATGKVTTAKNAMVHETHIQPPDDVCVWHADRGAWVAPEEPTSVSPVNDNLFALRPVTPNWNNERATSRSVDLSSAVSPKIPVTKG